MSAENDGCLNARFRIGARVTWHQSASDTGTVAEHRFTRAGRWVYVVAWDHDDLDRSEHRESQLRPDPWA